MSAYTLTRPTSFTAHEFDCRPVFAWQALDGTWHFRHRDEAGRVRKIPAKIAHVLKDDKFLYTMVIPDPDSIRQLERCPDAGAMGGEWQHYNHSHAYYTAKPLPGR